MGKSGEGRAVDRRLGEQPEQLAHRMLLDAQRDGGDLVRRQARVDAPKFRRDARCIDRRMNGPGRIFDVDPLPLTVVLCRHPPRVGLGIQPVQIGVGNDLDVAGETDERRVLESRAAELRRHNLTVDEGRGHDVAQAHQRVEGIGR